MASKADMTPEEREAKEQEEFSTGPLRWNNFDNILIYTNLSEISMGLSDM